MRPGRPLPQAMRTMTRATTPLLVPKTQASKSALRAGDRWETVELGAGPDKRLVLTRVKQGPADFVSLPPLSEDQPRCCVLM